MPADPGCLLRQGLADRPVVVAVRRFVRRRPLLPGLRGARRAEADHARILRDLDFDRHRPHRRRQSQRLQRHAPPPHLSQVTDGQRFARLALAAAALAPTRLLRDAPTICTFRRLTGRPCPSCGLTRSWNALARGRVGDSVRFSSAGPTDVCRRARGCRSAAGSSRSRFEALPGRSHHVWIRVDGGLDRADRAGTQADFARRGQRRRERRVVHARNAPATTNITPITAHAC